MQWNVIQRGMSSEASSELYVTNNLDYFYEAVYISGVAPTVHPIRSDGAMAQRRNGWLPDSATHRQLMSCIRWSGHLHDLAKSRRIIT
jgi:hypothetical protein